MPAQTSALTLQFLEWVASGQRTYVEAMDAWRTSCPRLSIWEDALGEGLIELGSGPTRGDAHVRITPRGRHVLESHPAS